MTKNTIIKDSIILCAITLIAGAALGFVYQITKAPIEKSKQDNKLNAYKGVFSDAANFVESDDFNNIAETSKEYLDKNGYEGISIDDILYATKENSDADKTVLKEDDILGYVMTITTSHGYGGDITISVGIKNDGTLNAMEILTINETAGLGMKAKEDDFKIQFSDKNVEEFEYTKTGSTADNEIDALSGATITTSAVTGAVNAGIAYATDELIKEE